jgi:3-aminobutyryl-CoA ammonia-lyase
VSGGFIMGLFGDVATILLQKTDGDGGLLAGYEIVEFIQPIYAGDVLNIDAKIITIGNTSRKFECTAWKVLQPYEKGPSASSAAYLEKPIKVCRAIGTGVVRKDKRRLTNKPNGTAAMLQGITTM